MMMIGSMHYHNTINALTFPDNFDSFLEILFEHAECEDFLSDNKWSNVGLRDCKPYVCNFPRELCRRPVAKYQDETSNTCFKIPDNCLTAANDGIPLAVTTNANLFTDNEIKISNIIESKLTAVTTTATSSSSSTDKELSSIPIEELPTKLIDSSVDICNLDQPQGKFCGFKIKVAYNRYNQRCEEFWFPGCRTIETNQNLFDTVDECMEKTKVCKGTGLFVPFFTTRHPASMITPSSPIPLVAPFLATTIVPRAKVPRFTDNTSAKSWISSITRPPQLLPCPSGSGSLLSLISNSISQFTGNGYGSGEIIDEDGGGLFHQIPQFLRLLQG
ncbi:hypothetical protein DINM_005977 [Dirofilaria immitis]|nr:hypothetical protein [Dirofilaria immitis]